MTRRSKSDRLALRLSRGMGVTLSNDEYEDTLDDLKDEDLDNDEDDGDIDLPPFNNPKGDVSMVELLSDLLGALGIKVQASGGEEQFKRALYSAAMAKIRELTGNGSTGNGDRPTNPLMPGADPSSVEADQPPVFMSLDQRTLARIENIADPKTKSIALALADAMPLAARQRTEQARDTARQREAKLDAARARRQARIDRILKAAPHVRNELDVFLNQPSMAFAMDASGNVTDPADRALAALEHRVRIERIAAHQPEPVGGQADDLDEAERALTRYMR